MKIEELKPIEVGGIDLSEFEGRKVKINELRIEEVPSQFSETGKQHVLKILTEPVTTITTSDGRKVEIRASEIANLKKDENGELGYSTSPKSKLQKLMTKMKVSEPDKLKGKLVTVIVRDDNFLGIREFRT